MARLKGKNAVITGAAHGIGRAIAEAYAKEGANIFFTALSDQQAAINVQQILQNTGVQASFALLDAKHHHNIKKLVQLSMEQLGSVDILVNNAAITTRHSFLQISERDYENIMAVNMRFPFFLTQAFSRQMKENKIAGSIINISSISATKAISKMAHYQCSKAALNMLTRGAAYELAEDNIRVNTISPGLTATHSNVSQWRDDPGLWHDRSKGIPLGRSGQPNDLAGAAVFLGSDESSWMTGGEIVIDGGDAVV